MKKTNINTCEWGGTIYPTESAADAAAAYSWLTADGCTSLAEVIDEIDSLNAELETLKRESPSMHARVIRGLDAALETIRASIDSDDWVQLADYCRPTESYREALLRAEHEGLTIGKHADPTQGGYLGLSVDDADDVASEDASLIYVCR